MQVNITARHIKLTPAIAEYVQKKLEKAKRHFDHLIWTQVILEVSKTRHIAEIVIHASGKTLTAKEEAGDLYAAIDLASDKIDEQLRRMKDRQRTRREARHRRSVGNAPEWASMGLPAIAMEEAPDYRISSVRVMRLVSQSISEAIHGMEASDSAHWIFLNSENDRATVIYRKPDKTYGVVESIL